VTFGEPGQLARLGRRPGDAAAKAVVYHAPRSRRPAGSAGPSEPRRTVFRIAIDRSGTVSSVEVTIPSAESAADRALAAELQAARYTPATLDGRPIAATVFVELAH
jgi:TonB family protein